MASAICVVKKLFLRRRQKKIKKNNQILDPGKDPLTDEEILMFFDLAQVPIDIEPLQLDHFKCVLNEILR
jgi:hypothetical protein